MKINKRIPAAITILILLTFFVSTTQAQGPNIMVIMDNSNSMNWNAYGEWPGNGEFVTAPYEDPNKPSYITNRVNTTGGTAEEYAYSTEPWTGSNSDLDLGDFNTDGNSKAYTGIRFTNVLVHQGRTINRAYIQLTSYRDLSGDCNLVVSAHDRDDGPYFNTNDINNLKDRFEPGEETTAHTIWNVPAWTQYQKDNDTRVDVTSIVQELVNRGGWNQGNAMVFLIEGTGKRDAHRNDLNVPTRSPELYIDYEPDERDDSDFLYYGYFDSGSLDNGNHTSSRYRYDGAKFVRDLDGPWDGNWLNWCTSRKVDVLRKVLVGGKPAGTTGDNAITNMGENSTTGWYRWHDDTTGINTPYHGNFWYEIDDGRLYVRDQTGSFLAEYNIQVLKDPDLEPEEFNPSGTALSGVLQSVGNQGRWGNMWYDQSDGGWLDNRIANSNVDNVIDSVQDKVCSTWTPVAETYLTAMQYFQQDTSFYESDRYPVNDMYDPYITDDSVVIPHTKSFVLLLTDGPSTQDMNIPSYLQNTDSDSNETDRTFSNDGSDYLDDIVYYSHINDLRPDLQGKQNLSLRIIYAFDDDPDARAFLKDAAINGGFKDMDNDSKPDITGDLRGGEWGDIGHNQEWDEDNDGEPDNYWEADNGFKLKASLLSAINDILESTDSDHDGINNFLDNCPLICNLNQTDADSDGIGDVCDPEPGCGGCGESSCEVSCDIDNDGVLNTEDNCPNNCNTQQLDFDNDTIGDVCDPEPGCGGCGHDPCEQECLL